MTSQDIVKEFSECYNQAYYAWNPFYPEADKDLRFYLSDQWDLKEKEYLNQAGRHPWVYNLIRKNINMVEGYQRSHRLSCVVVAQQSQDQQSADELSDLLQYVFQFGNGYKCISECFSGAIKTGWNLATVWMDYREDPVNGDIRFGREPYSGFITDPYFTQLDFSDCSFVLRRKYLSPSHAASLLPQHEELIYDLHQQGWSRDDKFTWLPYQRLPNGEQLLAYNEYFKQGWKKVPVVVDSQTGEYTEWSGSSELLKQYLNLYPQLKVTYQPKRIIENHIIVNDTYIKTETNQFGLNEYPMVPFVGIFEPENEFWQMKLQSLTRVMRGPQQLSNRLLCQMMDINESQLNSGWIAKEKSVVNPQSLFKTSQGGVIWLNEDHGMESLQKIPPAQIPASFFQLQEIYAHGPSNVLGINEASFGIPESGNESGLMMMLRQGSAVTNLQHVFDNLRYAQKLLAQKVLKLIQTWTPSKIEKILGKKPTEQFYSKEFVKYDISIQEGMMTETQRQIHFRQLVDLYQLTGGPHMSPITPQMLVKAAPIQGGSSLNQEIEQNQQLALQSQQQQSQIQQELLGAQLDYNKASSIEKLAGAKERFTRAFANVGLSDERAARAVDDRSAAALDRARAMRELSLIDDERLLKYLSIIQMMESMNKHKEEEIKQEDLAVASHGQELGDRQYYTPKKVLEEILGNQIEENSEELNNLL